VALTLRGLSFSYLPGTPLAREVLRGIDLEIEPGELVCLLGPSGSGKSTLAQIMNGLLAPSEGEVLLDDEPVNAGWLQLRELRSQVGLVFQNPERQLFAESVEADIAFGPRQQGFSKEEALASAREAARMLGLNFEELRQRSPFSLSFGQRRRVAIAGVLALDPSYLILDEPAAGLDPAGKRLMLDLVSALCEQGRGLVMITHNLEDAMQLADRVLLLADGRAVGLGTPEEVLADEALLAQAGYSLPPLLEVLHGLRAAGLPVPAFARSPEEAAQAIAEALRRGGEVR